MKWTQDMKDCRRHLRNIQRTYYSGHLSSDDLKLSLAMCRTERDKLKGELAATQTAHRLSMEQWKREVESYEAEVEQWKTTAEHREIAYNNAAKQREEHAAKARLFEEAFNSAGPELLRVEGERDGLKRYIENLENGTVIRTQEFLIEQLQAANHSYEKLLAEVKAQRDRLGDDIDGFLKDRDELRQVLSAVVRAYDEAPLPSSDPHEGIVNSFYAPLDNAIEKARKFTRSC